MFRTLRRAAGLALLGALAVPGSLHAQCIGPDNLTAPCWDPVDVQLPDLGDIVLPGAAICWNFCDPGVKDPVRMTLTTPVSVHCAQFLSDVKVETTTGVGVLSGTATLDYTRTWNEIAPSGREYQVWRFLVKVDLRREPGAPLACWNPPCIGPGGHPTCFWYGYVDYAENCATFATENAVVLYHACDDFTHNVFLSDRPAPAGGFHPNSFYALVAPDTAANPYDPGASPAPRTGTFATEAVRNVVNFTDPTLCTAEEPVSQGALQLLGQACLCPIIPSPVQSASHFVGAGTCPDPAGVPSSWLSLKLFNPAVGFNWFEMIGTSLGAWTTDFTYPGQEAPFAEEGFFVYHDSCAASVAGLPADTLDVMYGAKTIGGFDVLPDPGGGPPLQSFLDLASNYSEPTVILPLLGSVRPTDHLVYVNVP